MEAAIANILESLFNGTPFHDCKAGKEFIFPRYLLQ